MRTALEVARRCLCLELLFQRYLLEIDTSEPASERDAGRVAWGKRLSDLGVAEVLEPDERRLFDAAVGSLTEDDVDDLYGRASSASVLLWSLGRVPNRPTFAKGDMLEATMTDHGLLGDGSVAKARTAAETATLREEGVLSDAHGEYVRRRGKAREVDDPERVFADVAADQLAWVLEG